MRLLIDGDACPDKVEIKKIAQDYNIEMIVYIDYAHVMEDDYYRVVECEIGKDSVDMQMIKDARSGDLVITQDYGLASLLLCKNVKVLHVSGKEIHNGNVEELLMSRYLSAQQRKKDKHLKGPSKRDQETRDYFLKQIEKILKTAL
ncbi:MAG: DUF188 domain-containing protein [Longibaculum sp.]